MPNRIKGHHQVVIIGGGPGGTSCAIALARLGVKDVLILESGAYDRFRIGESVPPEVRPLFSKLGILEGFLAQNHEPCYGSCSYWGDDRRGYNDFIMSVYGYGWHLDRRRFNQFMAEQAQEAGAQLLSKVTFEQSEKLERGGYRLILKPSRKHAGPEDRKRLQIDADFVVDATGAGSVFARRQGSRQRNDRPLICLCARFSLQTGARITKMTHLEAAPYGWWYAARLPGNTMLVALSTDAETLKEQRLQHPDRWLNALLETPNTSQLIAHTRMIDSKPQSYPAPSFRLDKIVGPHWLAEGDAASAYDPLMSQGIIKSMSDGLISSQFIGKYLSGEEQALDVYERMVADRYNQYVEMRNYFYNLEQRWPQSTFWLNQRQTSLIG